jgi:biopolymer transport protein ExbD
MFYYRYALQAHRSIDLNNYRLHSKRHKRKPDVFPLVDLYLKNLYFFIKPITLTVRRHKRVTNPQEIET